MRFKKTVLYVDNSVDDCNSMTFIFERAGYDVVVCRTVGKCMRRVRGGNLSAIILGHPLAGMSGVDVCRWIKAFDETTPVVFLTGDGHALSREAGISAGANAYLVKPDQMNDILPAVAGLIKEAVKKKKQANRRLFLDAYDNTHYPVKLPTPDN